MLTELKEYLNNTSSEVIAQEWESVKHFENVGPLVTDILDDWRCQSNMADIDVDDYYNEMSSTEKEIMADLLEEDGFFTEKECDCEDESLPCTGFFDHILLIDDLEKINTAYYLLSPEDLQTIKNIANKY